MSLYYLTTNLVNSTTKITSNSTSHSLFGTANLHDDVPGIPCKFALSSTESQFTFEFDTPVEIDFCSVHGHNLGAGTTAIQLRSSSDKFVGDDSLRATLTSSAQPAFYKMLTCSFTESSWRLKFLGTPTCSISVGEVWLGVANDLGTTQQYNWNVTVTQPQIRQVAPSGQVYVSKRTAQRNRVLSMSFFGTAETDKDEIEETLIDATDWGVRPIVIVPDSDDDIVIHGRVGESWGYSHVVGGFKYKLTITEDPFEEEYL